MEMARKGQGIGIVDGLQGGFGGEDVLRELVQRTVQQVLEAEMTSFLGAGTYERNGERRGGRNGYKPRTLKTRAGTIDLMVPKDRDGEFQTELFERYQRGEKALVLAMLEMYVGGVSTRKVSAITEALCGLEVSKSQVSALTQKLDAEIAAWRMRPLTQSYPYLVVDARYEKVRHGGAVVSQGVRYVVSDDHAGMVKAIGRHFQGAVWQRCQVHFVRNALSLGGVAQRPLVLSLMRSVTEAPTREAALKAAVEALAKKAPKTASLLEEHGEEILGVYALPEPHSKRMRTTNMLERQNQEMKRRTRVVRVFPHAASCLRLVSALLIETSQQWMERLYLRMEDQEEPAEQTPAQAA